MVASFFQRGLFFCCTKRCRAVQSSGCLKQRAVGRFARESAARLQSHGAVLVPIIIYGSKGVISELSSGNFICPHCQNPSGYALKKIQRHFTFFSSLSSQSAAASALWNAITAVASSRKRF